MPDDAFGSALPFLTEVAEDYGASLYEVMQPYPPTTISNSPDNPKRKWYERGYGERWKRKDGSVGGRPTSGQLGDQWVRLTEPVDDTEVDATLTNVAQNQMDGNYYAIDVQGQLGMQSAVMAGIGWKSVDTGLDETVGQLDELLGRALDAIIESM